MNVLMLVSANATPQLRREVAAGLRPVPEYLRLEELHGVRLLDWTKLGKDRGHRSITRSLRHVAAALAETREVDVVLSDGEHLGIPLALAMRSFGVSTPHLVIGHRLVTPAKTPAFRWAKAHRRMDRIVVHSPNQVELIVRELHIPVSRVRVVPYGVDTAFWSPQPVVEEDDLVLSAGREHRDYGTLAQACSGTGRLFVADHSSHSPKAFRKDPVAWPGNVTRGTLGKLELRQFYARASVVVVPLVPTEFPFGITAVLEAMSMGKAVVVSETQGLRGVVEHGRTGIVVPPADVAALRDSVRELVGRPEQRRRLGQAAREFVVERYGLDVYVAQLASQLRELCGHPAQPAMETGATRR